MRLDGIHHVTCITGDAPRNVDFYTRVLGLRMVKKTVNQDDPTVYHLFYADENGSPGSDITFCEYPGARRGRDGAGMVHTVTWLAGRRARGRLRFDDPEGLGLELAAVETPDAPLVAEHPEIPAQLALQGLDGVRAFAADPDASRDLLERTLGFASVDDGWEARGPTRGGRYAYDPPPAERGSGGAGTVHHVAWCAEVGDIDRWLETVAAAGRQPSGVIDRFWFRSVYFREPSGVLFELATRGPGFAVDEDPERLGERLTLPPAFEHLRDRLDSILTPLPDPRPWARTG